MRKRQEVEHLLYLGCFWTDIGKAALWRNFKVNVALATQESYSETWNTGTNMKFAMGTTRIYNVLNLYLLNIVTVSACLFDDIERHTISTYDICSEVS